MENTERTQAGARKVVPVVEDELAIGRLIADAISDEPGYCAIHVAAPVAALEATEQITPDVMVIDVRLPGMSSFELYDRLKKDPRSKGRRALRDGERDGGDRRVPPPGYRDLREEAVRSERGRRVRKTPRHRT